jgi:hypothetical protein
MEPAEQPSLGASDCRKGIYPRRGQDADQRALGVMPENDSVQPTTAGPVVGCSVLRKL